MLEIQTTEDLIQNLQDAGVPAECIARFLSCRAAQDERAALQILAQQRAILLDQVHAGEKKIDCLDYLVYQLRREMEQAADKQEATKR